MMNKPTLAIINSFYMTRNSSIAISILIAITISGCDLFKYNSRKEALSACDKWENEKSMKIFTPSGFMFSKSCELEIESRQVLGLQIERPDPMRVYTEELLDKDLKVKKKFGY
jgi:hypothetical protein